MPQCSPAERIEPADVQPEEAGERLLPLLLEPPERDDERASVGVEYVNVGFGRTQRAGRRP
jgi:hypothetical protein